MPNIYNRLGVEREKIIKIEFFYLVLNSRNLFIVQSLHIFSSKSRGEKLRGWVKQKSYFHSRNLHGKKLKTEHCRVNLNYRTAAINRKCSSKVWEGRGAPPVTIIFSDTPWSSPPSMSYKLMCLKIDQIFSICNYTQTRWLFTIDK